MSSGLAAAIVLSVGAHVRRCPWRWPPAATIVPPSFLNSSAKTCCEGLGVGAAVVDGGGRLEAQLVVHELGRGLALERVAVGRSEVARVRRVAIRGGQRRAGVRRRDRRQAGFGDGLDAADGLVGAGRADEARRGCCRPPASGRGRAALGRAQAVFRGQQDVVALERAAQVVDGDLDALLGVLTQGRIGPGQDAPVGDVDRLAGRDLDGAERILDGAGCAGRRRSAGAVLAAGARRSRRAAAAARRERQDADGRERTHLVQFHPSTPPKITGRIHPAPDRCTVTRSDPRRPSARCVSRSPPRATITVRMVRDGWCHEVHGGRRADGRRSDAVYYPPAIRLQQSRWPHPSARRERHIARRRRGDRGPRSSLDRTPIEGVRIASPARYDPIGVEYLVRAARVTDIDRIVALRDDGRSDGPWREPARCRGSPAPARLPAAGQCRRRRDAATRRGWGGPRPAAVGHRRRLSSGPSTSWSSIPGTTPIASPKPSSRSCFDRPATRAAPSSRRSSRTIRWSGRDWNDSGSARPDPDSNEP